MVAVPLGEWLPDLPEYQNPGAITLKNVIPGLNSVRPFKAFSAYSATPLSARAQGGYYTTDSSGGAKQFSGDISKLYLLSSLDWTDVSKAATTYATADTDMWDFVQFGGIVIAVNGADVPQKFTLDSATAFVDLTGSPPTGPRYVEVMGDFVVFARMAAAASRVQWSGINNAETWATSATTQADQQDLPDGGDITGLIGYDYGGIVFQKNAIRRMDYEGSPIIFRFKKLSQTTGATIPGSVHGYEGRAFFMHRSGLHMILGASDIIPIGANKVNQWFWNNIDLANQHRVTSAIDPINNLYCLSFPSTGAANGVPNTILLYNWDVNRFAYCEPGDLDMIYSGTSQGGYTLAGLDAVSATLGGLPFPLGSPVWSGIPTPLLAGFNTSHNLAYANGDALEVLADTQEAQLNPGRRSFVRALRPIVDGGTPTVALGTRDRINDMATFGSDVTLDSQGYCRFLSNFRYHRGRIKIPAGSTWTHLLGLDDIDASRGGAI